MRYSFVSSQDYKIQIEKLSYSYCLEHQEELINIINIIPHIHWTIYELLFQDMDYYGNKWNYSYVIKNEDRIIGVLIAYFRIADQKHIFDSLYIHRFAIMPEYQNMGIGTETLKYFIKKSFSEIPWLLNISGQTNDCIENDHFINFYKKIGFKEMYNIIYPEKKDILMLLERGTYINDYHKKNDNKNDNKSLRLKHPRISGSTIAFESVLPVVYFSSSNNRKKEIVKFIFNNYNIEVKFVVPKIELTEPQIERPELEEERKLVSFPLKNLSRFIDIDSVPYTIEDTMLFVEFFNRNGDNWELPGLDTKRWLRQMGLDGFLEIMGDTNKRRAKFVSQTGAYVKANQYCYGRGELMGSIAYSKAEVIKPKYGTYPFFFHLLFIPEGANKTLAEMDMYEYAQYDYMRKSIVQLIEELSLKELFQNSIYKQITLFDL